MDNINIDNLIRFSDFFKKILAILYPDESGAIYAFYERKEQFSFNYPKLTAYPTVYKIYCAILKYESIVLIEDDVTLYDVLHTGENYKIRELPKYKYIEEKDFLYESQGLKDNGWTNPKSELYISRNALNYFYVNRKNSLINHNLFKSDFLLQVEEIYQAIIRKKYRITPDTTAKMLFKHIIEPLYPHMSENSKTLIHRIFKGENDQPNQSLC